MPELEIRFAVHENGAPYRPSIESDWPARTPESIESMSLQDSGLQAQFSLGTHDRSAQSWARTVGIPGREP